MCFTQHAAWLMELVYILCKLKLKCNLITEYVLFHCYQRFNENWKYLRFCHSCLHLSSQNLMMT